MLRIGRPGTVHPEAFHSGVLSRSAKTFGHICLSLSSPQSQCLGLKVMVMARVRIRVRVDLTS